MSHFIPGHSATELDSASNYLVFPNLAALSLYPHIFAVYDSNPADDLDFAQIYQYLRNILI